MIIGSIQVFLFCSFIILATSRLINNHENKDEYIAISGEEITVPTINNYMTEGYKKLLNGDKCPQFSFQIAFASPETTYNNDTFFCEPGSSAIQLSVYMDCYARYLGCYPKLPKFPSLGRYSPCRYAIIKEARKSVIDYDVLSDVFEYFTGCTLQQFSEGNCTRDIMKKAKKANTKVNISKSSSKVIIDTGRGSLLGETTYNSQMTVKSTDDYLSVHIADYSNKLTVNFSMKMVK
uniref:Uncharacterized protein n=1 Tax=Ditylenchus dipsaci TaxID=166011 RepID=A0A915EN00_9BILA